jgi:hypothetical protein
MVSVLRHGAAVIATAGCVFTFGVTATPRYVDSGCTNATPPFTDWARAATNIKDAIDVSADGDLIQVTNGVYAWGGRAMASTLRNRVVLDKALTVQSVNDPFATVIRGAGATNGNSAVRCAWLTNTNYSSTCTQCYCDSHALPAGTGNIDADPQLLADGVHLTATSPCRGAGANIVSGTDIDDQLWANPPSIGCDEWQPAAVVLGLITASVQVC